MGHIFISYSHKDTDYAHALADHLHGLGFETWIDERLDYGSRWPQELQTQLDSCSAFILIMSPRSYDSDWVQSELQRARRKLKPIFPLLLEGNEPWLSVESTQFYDVRGNVYPDAKFYSALKKVLTPSLAAQTLKAPREAVRERLTGQAIRPGWGMLSAGGLVLIALIAGVGLLMRPLLQGASTPTTEPSLAAAAPATDSPAATQELESGPTARSTVTRASNTDDEMVLIPAGEFRMGRNAADELAECLEKFHSECQLSWFLDAEPIHEVVLADFHIDLYEVTNEQYKACEDAGACEPPRSFLSNTRQSYYGNPEFDRYPVIQVTWDQARTYCEWRGARLPTEAEWEKAARGTDGRTYPWGEELSDSFANFNWNIGDTTAVGSYESGRSPYGVYDMAGNVWEWVSSLHRPYPYRADDGREDLASQGLRVMRGGSWGQEGNNSVSSTYRFGSEPGRTNIDLGFRCAQDENP